MAESSVDMMALGDAGHGELWGWAKYRYLGGVKEARVCRPRPLIRWLSFLVGLRQADTAGRQKIFKKAPSPTLLALWKKLLGSAAPHILLQPHFPHHSTPGRYRNPIDSVVVDQDHLNQKEKIKIICTGHSAKPKTRQDPSLSAVCLKVWTTSIHHRINSCSFSSSPEQPRLRHLIELVRAQTKSSKKSL
ncbi:hypothetical protein QC762_0067220 [Podospora pseudocomata]|uniref:Uncharacterized protein n=1 Tax=Podospora pseudocomata TaxID=2093779 RepID=A0ABR0GFT2_9PEZI|nr:hypothetical protein QC762_0067220 [Podospora pseudocomata]